MMCALYMHCMCIHSMCVMYVLLFVCGLKDVNPTGVVFEERPAAPPVSGGVIE